MKAVFVGGSRKLSRLNEAVRHRLGLIIERRLWVYVGDANGADKALQQFFASHRYDRVVVYHAGDRYRNNVGHWQTRPIDPPPGARGFEYYAAKDIQMACDASFGLMLWDGVSRGTLANIRSLVAQRKPVAVYHSPQRRFQDVRRQADLAELLSSQLSDADSTRTPSALRQRDLALNARRRRKGNAA